MADKKDTTGRIMTAGTPGLGQGAKAPLNPDPLDGPIPPKTADTQPLTDQTTELGATGTILVHGILSNVDYNPQLEGTQRIKIFDEMRKSDSTVRLGLMAVKFPILGAKWYIKPPISETKKKKADTKPGQPVEDDEITTFIKNQLFFNESFSWTSLLHQILLFCDYGNSFFEKVFTKTPEGKIGWKKFAQRLPQTVYRYTFQDGITPGITQILPTGGYAEIPQWKLVMFVNEMEGSNYEGMSLLRACYKPWYYKDLYYKIDAIATERQGVGMPQITAPPQATPEDKLKAQEIARNMRANEQAYVNLPEGFTVEWIDPKAKELKDAKEMILHHDRSILKAFIAHFLDLGAQSTGSFALSSNQEELFLQSLKYLAKIIQENLNHAIRELVDMNFTVTDKIEGYPTLEFGSIGQVDVDKFSQALERLAQGGVIIPDEDLERHVRNLLELPEAMQISEEDHNDPDLAKIPVAPDGPQDTQLKKPLRYSASPAQAGTAMMPPPPPSTPFQARMAQRNMNETTFSEHRLENLMALEEELQQIIQSKQ